MDIEDAIYQFYDRDSSGKRKDACQSKVLIPAAVRALRYNELRKNSNERKRTYTPAGQKLPASEMRIRALMTADRQAQRQQRQAESESKRQTLLNSKERQPVLPQIKDVPGSRNAVPPQRDQHHLHLSPRQRAAGYVARYTPGQSAIATGSMGAIANGAKEQGITALFNAALDIGKKKGKDFIAGRSSSLLKRYRAISKDLADCERAGDQSSLKVARDFGTNDKASHSKTPVATINGGAAPRSRSAKVAEATTSYGKQNKNGSKQSGGKSALRTLLETKHIDRSFDREKRREDDRGADR